MHRLERKFISRNLIFNKKFVHVHLFQYIESIPKFFLNHFLIFYIQFRQLFNS